MEDNRTPPSKSGGAVPFSWWDIQDENARLPVKESTPSELEHMFFPKLSSHVSSSDSATKAAKGAFKSLGKAMNAVVDTAAGSGIDPEGSKVGVIVFKLVDLIQLHDAFDHKHQGHAHAPPKQPRPARQPQPQPRRTPPSQHQQQPRAAPTPARTSAPPPAARTPAPQSRGVPQPRTQQRQQQAPSRRTTPAAPRTSQRSAAPPADLMGFGATAASPPVASSSASGAALNETRTEKLKREYANKQTKSNRVWDAIDERWVEVESKASAKAGTGSAPPGDSTVAGLASGRSSSTKVKGIKLDASNAVGKSANVQAAVHKRVNDMQESRAKALKEVREREAKKQADDAEEDDVRKRLEPKIKTWSEEHGKKKQLRALLGSMQVILWPGSSWKAVTIGDLLDDSKVKRCYHKASRVVHPDKTHHLDAEKRFLAKRIFDALSQAKTEFDESCN